MRNKLFFNLIIFLTLFFTPLVSCFADEGIKSNEEVETAPDVEKEQPKLIDGIEILAGYGTSNIKSKTDSEEKRNYNLYPLYVDFNFNLKKLIQKTGFNPPVAIKFQIEPYIANVTSPDSNVEVGNSFMFKVGLVPEDWKIQPYVKAGVGFLYMSQHTREQSTQFNFIETGAFGANFYLTKNTALTVEGRIRHLSNAGIDSPNSGINTYFGVAGISYNF